MFALSKTFGHLLMPVGIFWLALLAGALVGWLKRSRWGWASLIGFVFLGLAGNVQLSQLAIGGLEREGLHVPPSTLDALYVLGGGTSVDPLRGAHAGVWGDRVLQAARLYRRGLVRSLVAGGAGEKRDLGQETRQIWLDLGIPDQAIVALDRPCLNTTEEIGALKELAASRGWKELGILSSGWHLPRTLRLAHRAGLQVVPLRADPQGTIRPFQVWDLVPRAEGLHRLEWACWERLGPLIGR